MPLNTDDIDTIRKWPMTSDPFAAVKEYTTLKLIARWLRPAHRQASKHYTQQRIDWIQNTNFEDYFEKCDRTIDRKKWEYLQLRKSWYQIPLHWNKLADEKCTRVLDLGCGDGDFTQRVADYIADEWQRTGKGHQLEIVGIDLSPSRISNAQNHCQPKDDRITMTFQTADATKGLPFDDQHFDYSLNTGVLEILEDDSANAFAKELCRVTKYGHYTEDLADRYPGGYPREDLNVLFEPHGFRVTDKKVVLTEPFAKDVNPEPCRIWPILRDQIVWAERVNA